MTQEMETTRVLAEVVLQDRFESWASCSDNSVRYLCRHCRSWAAPSPDNYEHDSECPVLLAEKIIQNS